MSKTNKKHADEKYSHAVSKPSVWNYRNPRVFLQDMTVFNKQTVEGFSFRKVALEAQLASPNYVQKFLSGQRHFKDDTAYRVGIAYGLTDPESDFFVLMVRFDAAKTMQERRALYRELLDQAVNVGAARIDVARLEYFSRWYIPVIHAMASLVAFEYDASTIAQTLVPAIRKNEASHALKVLAELGILLPDDDEPRGYTVASPEAQTDESIQAIWLQEYHHAMISLGLQASEQWQKDVRNISSLTVTLRNDQVDWLVRKLDRFRNELFSDILSAQQADDFVDGEVFQINLQAFPVTGISLEPNPIVQRQTKAPTDA